MSDGPLERAKRLANTPYQVDRLRSSLDRIHARLDALEAQSSARAAATDLFVRQEMLRLRAMVQRGVARPAPAPDKVSEALDLEAGKRALAAIAPRAYAVWSPLLEVNEAAYHQDPADNCSVDGHAVAELFGLFLRSYLTGAVLDIGCGPQEIPSYLRDYPVSSLAGLDPLPPRTSHPFQFHQGVAEYLPWPDRSFQTVSVATSLDHVLLLDRTLAEIARVMTTDGTFVLWVGLVPGSPRYDPHAANVAKVDAFHLFHCDRGWLEEELSKTFRIEESFSLGAGNSSHFYALKLR